MKFSLPAFAALLCFTACNNEKDTKPVAEKAEPEQTAPVPAPRNSQYDHLLLDTSIDFASLKEVSTYANQKHKEWNQFKKDSVAKHPGNTALEYQIDSVGRILQEQQAYLIIRELWQSEKTKNNVQLIAYNQVFSNLVPFSERMRLFEAFPVEVQKSAAGQSVLERLAKYEKRDNVGRNLKELNSFAVEDSNHRKIAFVDFLNNNKPYSLIIFTASWCSPCRYEARQIKSQWNRYDSSMIQFVSISVDNSDKKWRKFLREETSPWPQYISRGEFESPLAKSFDLNSIPLNVLVDGSGKVIDEDVSLERLAQRHPNVL